MPLSRRRFLLSLSSLLAAHTVLRGATTPRKDPSPFRFIVVNDLHHATAECDPFFEHLVTQMHTHGQIAFVLAVGDLADTGTRESLGAVQRIFHRLDAPFYPVPGNHDCDVTLNPSLYAEVFPGRLNYHFAHSGWQFLGLDTTDANLWKETRISEATLRYLDSVRPALDPHAPTVVFTHFPLGEGVKYRPQNADELLTRLAGLEVRAVFGGHYHANTKRQWRGATIETNVCCARMRANHDQTQIEGYRLCTAHPDGTLTQEFVEFVPATESPAAIVS